MNITRKNIVWGLCITVIIIIASIGLALMYKNNGQKNPEAAATATTSVATSTPVLDEIAQAVGGTMVTVQKIDRTGIDVHDFEPTPRNVAKMYEADLFIYNGEGLDAWAEKIATTVEEKGVSTLEMTSTVPLIEIEEHEEEHGEEAAHEHEEEHEHGAHDPHIWLSPTLMITQTNAVRDALIAIDANNADTYTKNAAEYTMKLSALDAAYKKELSTCTLREIVVAHDAFGYLAKEYTITMHPISGISPESEPSIQDLQEIITLVKEKKINTIFFEALASPKLSETIATETGAKTAVLSPLEGFTEEEMTNNENYISVMQKNLTALKEAMECK